MEKDGLRAKDWNLSGFALECHPLLRVAMGDILKALHPPSNTFMGTNGGLFNSPFDGTVADVCSSRHYRLSSTSRALRTTESGEKGF